MGDFVLHCARIDHPPHGAEETSMLRMIRRSIPVGIGLLLFLLTPTTGIAQDRTWPREMNTSKYILTLYQPQPEKHEGNILRACSTVSLLQAGKTSPVVGVGSI